MPSNNVTAQRSSKQCPLCGTTLIPRYEFKDYGDGLRTIQVRYICPDCIPPEAPQ